MGCGGPGPGCLEGCPPQPLKPPGGSLTTVSPHLSPAAAGWPRAGSWLVTGQWDGDTGEELILTSWKTGCLEKKIQASCQHQAGLSTEPPLSHTSPPFNRLRANRAPRTFPPGSPALRPGPESGGHAPSLQEAGRPVRDSVSFAGRAPVSVEAKGRASAATRPVRWAARQRPGAATVVMRAGAPGLVQPGGRAGMGGLPASLLAAPPRYSPAFPPDLCAEALRWGGQAGAPRVFPRLARAPRAASGREGAARPQACIHPESD